MSEFQRRRFWRAWLPVTLVGVALMIAAVGVSVTVNGLTLLGSTTALTGLGLMVWESRDE